MLYCRVSEVRLVEVEAAAAQQTLVVHLATGVLVTPEIQRSFFCKPRGLDLSRHVLDLSRHVLDLSRLVLD
jgi:hypothetical protein